MSEERLIEITSEIIRQNGPFLRLIYIASLSKEEIEFLHGYLKGSKNYYVDIVEFSYNYLKSKNILINMPSDLSPFEDMQSVQYKYNNVTYLQKMFEGDSEEQVMGVRRR